MTQPICTPIRLGLIGCGGIAFWAHLRSLRTLSRFQLTLAADPDPAARQRAATLTRARLVSNPDEILHNPDIDALLIAAPSQLHASLAQQAVHHRKPFFLEKPLAASAEEGLHTLQSIRTAGITTRLGFNRRYHPVHRLARQLLRAGTIGPVRSVQTAFCEAASGEALPAWKRKRSTAGGVLLDLGSHHFDLLCWFLDIPIESVHAFTTSTHSEQDSANVHVTFAGGITAQSHFSFLSGPFDHLEFHGELGSLRVDRHHPHPIVRLRRRTRYGLSDASPTLSPSIIQHRLLHLLRPGHDPSYRRALDGFADALLGKPDGGADATDGWASLAAVLAAERSAESGQRIPVLLS
jgi:myo-inositol 2-dehydrogenase/D-chiro-inositol 1-dehydrogenase